MLVFLFLPFKTATAGLDGYSQEVNINVNGEKAGSKSYQCCRLKHNIEAWGETFEAGNWVGVPEGAANPEACPDSDPSNYKGTPNWQGICAMEAAYTLSETIRWIGFFVVGFFIFLSTILYATAGANVNRQQKARKWLFTILGGIFIIVLSAFIPSVVRFFIGL